MVRSPLSPIKPAVGRTRLPEGVSGQARVISSYVTWSEMLKLGERSCERPPRLARGARMPAENSPGGSRSLGRTPQHRGQAARRAAVPSGHGLVASLVCLIENYYFFIKDLREHNRESRPFGYGPQKP